jgi:hypothetical protein
MAANALRLEWLHTLRERAREERGGRVYSSDEVLDLIRETARG